MTIVDVHCHTFNGDDLPVRGFVQRVLLGNQAALRLVSWVLDRVGQDGTPGYEAERAQLDRLLGYETSGLAAFAYVGEPPFDSVVDEVFTTALREDQLLLVDAERELAIANQGSPPGPEAFSLVDGFGAVRRTIAWTVLMRRSRLDITRRLVSTYPEVDLFTPMTVDMAIGLRDTPEVSPLEQLELHEKLSRLSMLDRLQAGSHARVHPFVGFDPRSQLRSRTVPDVISALEVVELAIQRFGFVGIKLYPPMGFRPTDNSAGPEMTADQARDVDSILDDLYSWCEEEDVPITVHCNASNQVLDEYRSFSEPVLWGKVLERHGGLHLNLGHFGGAREQDDPNDTAAKWPDEIARLAKENLTLFADSGNHRIDVSTLADAYFAKLLALFASDAPTSQMKDRLMYGSDWYMLALLPNAEAFLRNYRDRFMASFGDVAAARFMGGTALDFLGLSDPGNKNRQRLIARYQDVNADLPGWLRP